MALNADSWFSQSTIGALPRLLPDSRPDSVEVATFAGGTAETLPIGTPVYVAAATGFVAKLIPGSGTAEQTETWGFVYPQPVATKASGEVLGTIMIRGQATYGDIRLLLNAVVSGAPLAGTETQLKTALRKSIVRERGLYINGLDLLGGP